MKIISGELASCLIQIVYLFGEWGTLPGNYTYASYARKGFFQLVFVCLINLALVLVMIYRGSFPLTRYCVVTVIVLYLMLSFAHPDYWIARYNLDHSIYQEEIAEDASNNGFDDFYYLSCLSYDAAPVIFGNAQKLEYGETYWFSSYSGNIPEKLPIRKWNLSRWMAFRLYSDYSSSHLTH